ncbi:MAG: Retron-type reverse transcriptase [Bacillota bacterium]|nr:MAG: Retron-type reverse transcriptase [Bacillota bacterium]MBS3949938.1 maturase [Peptococcaceae bacterium]
MYYIVDADIKGFFDHVDHDWLLSFLKERKQWLVKNMHTPTKELISTLRSKVRGHYNYYGLTDNRDSLSKFYQEVIKMLKWTLGRQSQKSRQTWEDIMKFLRKYPLPYPKIYHSIFYSKEA